MDDKAYASEYDKLRVIYNDIIRGFSYFESKNIFIKHLNEAEQSIIVQKKIEAFRRYQKQGLPSIKEKLKQLDDDKIWTKVEEDKILELKTIISDNEKNLSLIIPEQHKFIKDILKKHEGELTTLLTEKYHLLGKTADEQAEKDSSDTLIFLSFFKNRQLTDHFFENSDDVADTDEDVLREYKDLMDEMYVGLQEENLSKIAALPFFLNPFSFSKDDLYNFIGKPISQLTAFQLILFSLGSRNLDIRSKNVDSPEVGVASIDDIVKWYDTQHSINLGQRQTGKIGITKTVKEVVK